MIQQDTDPKTCTLGKLQPHIFQKWKKKEEKTTTKKAEKDTARGICQPLLSFCVGVLPNANDIKEMICLSFYPNTANSS